uniref:Uncharacterized protein n=1 Tax=Neobacillus citreus TaxID=2833578 RepID=A0A942SYN2_9BACI
MEPFWWVPGASGRFRRHGTRALRASRPFAGSVHPRGPGIPRRATWLTGGHD